MAEEKQPLSIPYPPPHIFKYRNTYMRPSAGVMQQKQAMFIWDHMEYPESGGQYAYFQGVPYPSKGHPFPEAIYGINMAKRLTVIGLKYVATLYRGKRIERLLESYCNVCEMFIEPFILHERYYSPFALELMIFIKNFLVEWGIGNDLSVRVAEKIASQFEYDNAYRLRGEDAMSESSKKLFLDHPLKEMKRIFEIIGKREIHHGVGSNEEKYASFYKIFRILMWIPKFRRSFKKAIELCEFEKFQLDEADRYHILIWADYNFLGKPISERMEMFKNHPYHVEHGLPKQIIANP